MSIIGDNLKDKLDEKSAKVMNFASDGCSRMSDLINSLLDLSRVSTKKEPFAPVDMNEALRLAISNLNETAEKEKAVITYDALGSVKGDKIQIVMLFQNLIANAIKFRKKEANPSIHVSSSILDGQKTYCVEDNGIGIDPSYYEKIFVIFKRLHTREEYPGTGIGLAVCKKIVERHGGRIWVESEAGKGTKFFFTLSRQ